MPTFFWSVVMGIYGGGTAVVAVTPSEDVIGTVARNVMLLKNISRSEQLLTTHARQTRL